MEARRARPTLDNLSGGRVTLTVGLGVAGRTGSGCSRTTPAGGCAPTARRGPGDAAGAVGRPGVPPPRRPTRPAGRSAPAAARRCSGPASRSGSSAPGPARVDGPGRALGRLAAATRPHRSSEPGGEPDVLRAGVAWIRARRGARALDGRIRRRGRGQHAGGTRGRRSGVRPWAAAGATWWLDADWTDIDPARVRAAATRRLHGRPADAVDIGNVTEGYLTRIGYAGPVVRHAETLAALHRAHMLAVPFENLDIHLGVPQTCLDSEPRVRQGRAPAAAAAGASSSTASSRSCSSGSGSRVTRYSAAVVARATPHFPDFAHLTLRVDLERAVAVQTSASATASRCRSGWTTPPTARRRAGLPAGAAPADRVTLLQDGSRQYVFTLTPRGCPSSRDVRRPADAARVLHRLADLLPHRGRPA